MITLGRSYELEVCKQVDFGFYLDAGDLGEVLLPRRAAPKDLEIVASSKVDQFVEDDSGRAFKPLDQVDLIIANSTDLGFKAIVNNRYWGVLYRDEVFQRLRRSAANQRCTVDE